MMLRLSRRFANNLSMNFNYTYSQIHDIVDNDSDAISDPFNIARNWGPAGYDQTNVLTLDFVYDFPKMKTGSQLVKQIVNGWEASGMIRSQSGMPINVSSNGNLYGMNLGSNFANQSGDPYAGQNSFQWLNPAAFTRPQDGQWGTIGRNSLRLPGVRNVDASIMKNFNFTETAKLTFRCEVFNLFNHPQPWGINNGFSGDNPGSSISATAKNFGQINNYRDARTMQLALRFSF